MAAKKTSKAIEKVDPDLIAQLQANFPQEEGGTRMQFPRLSMLAQDKTEEKGTGRNKTITVVASAGSFFIEEPTDEDELDEDTGERTGRKVWRKEDIGDDITGIVIFQRKQLRMYDESTKLYTSSPIYDEDTEVVPLFSNKKEVARGTPAELKALYEFVDKRDGKTKSKLEDNKILYVILPDYSKEETRVFQLNLRGSSMYSFKTYARKTIVPSVLTRFSSEPKENGSISWNQMTFEAVSQLTNEQLEKVLEAQDAIKGALASEKAAYAKKKDDDFYTPEEQAKLAAGKEDPIKKDVGF